MPANSLIVGVDLSPIKPIPRVITFQSDITTDKCRATIRSHFKTWKADTVLHDGAPNVGTAWVQDAFSQAELVLQAMKLATEFLAEGGTFVTKVFRSKDYNALLWVFNQLFTKVEATKPPSSRNVSAEIFVVCRGYKAPKRIDPRFLDPRSVFAELADPTPNNEAKVFNPEVKKRKRDGYEDGNYTQFKEVPASEFIQTTDPIAMLGSLNRLSFKQKDNGDIALAALDKLEETTPEVRQCCQDLKVLGRKEFRVLLRWRLKARALFGFATKKAADAPTESEEVAEITPMDEDLRILEELETLNDKENSRKKRERRRANEQKQREIVRMQMHMMPPTEIGLEQTGPNGEDSMFALSTVDRAGAIDKVAHGRMATSVVVDTKKDDLHSSSDEDSDAEEDRLDRELDSLYVQYQEHKSDADAKFRAKKARKERGDGEWAGFSDDGHSSSDQIEEDQESEVSSEDEEAPIVKTLIQRADGMKGGKDGLTTRAALFFDQDIFKDVGGIDTESGDDSAIDMQEDAAEKSHSGVVNAASKSVGVRNTHLSQLVDAKQKVDGNAEVASQPPRKLSEHSSIDDQDGFELVKTDMNEWDKQAERRQDGRLGKFFS